MFGAYVIAYATFMDPAKARLSGLVSSPDLIRVHDMQRVFAFPELAGRDPTGVFDRSGGLVVRDISSSTILPAPSHSFNAVVFRDVSDRTLDSLDAAEAKSHLERIRIPPEYLTYFGADGRSRTPYAGRDAPLFAYAAKQRVALPGLGEVQLVRQDVFPDPRYLGKCRTAASVHGEQFAAVYEQTTFLADRRTTISEFGAWASRR